MIAKEKEKRAAIKFRKQGFSYTEILEKVPVSKSTLSVWLKDIGLAQEQKQRFTEKRRLAQVKARETWRNIRVMKEAGIVASARKEIRKISRRELWLIGIVLYWAEGTKQKPHTVSQKVSFNNSDPKMVLLFNQWVQKICLRKQSDLTYSIYIHRTADRLRAQKFWENLLRTRIDKVYYKSHNPKTNRKNTQADYVGLLRIDVKKSTDLNRIIRGWIEGVAKGLDI